MADTASLEKKDASLNGFKIHGGVAQLGEHLPCKQGVMGSNPIISTSKTERPCTSGKSSRK